MGHTSQGTGGQSVSLTDSTTVMHGVPQRLHADTAAKLLIFVLSHVVHAWGKNSRPITKVHAMMTHRPTIPTAEQRHTAHKCTN